MGCALALPLEHGAIWWAAAAVVVVAICKSKTARYNIHPGSPKMKKIKYSTLGQVKCDADAAAAAYFFLHIYFYTPPLTLPRSEHRAAAGAATWARLGSRQQSASFSWSCVKAAPQMRLSVGAELRRSVSIGKQTQTQAQRQRLQLSSSIPKPKSNSNSKQERGTWNV